VALSALKLRDVAEIYRVAKGPSRFMAGQALKAREIAELDRMLKWSGPGILLGRPG